MRSFFFFAYLLAGILTASAFYWANRLSFDVSAGYAGGNGNAGIFPIVLLFPVILFFVYGTVEYSMRIAERQRNAVNTVISLLAAATTGLVIAVFTFLSAIRLQDRVVQEVEIYRDLGRIPLLSPYTNEIFFNPLTFLMMLLFCYSLGAGWALKRKKRNYRRRVSEVE